MTLHPFISAMLQKQKELGQKALSAGTPEDARLQIAAARSALGRKQTITDIRELEIPTRSGSIPARLFLPAGDVTSLVIYLHGGGWMIGALDDFDTLAREVAYRSKSAVLLPDYRLAPEHPFPAGLQDCEDTLAWAVDTVALIGQELPLVVAGDSAGANLATIVARKVSRRIPLALQILIYPVTDCDLETASYRTESDGMPITRTDMQWFFHHYAPISQHADPDISPLRAVDLGGMPPALIMTCEHDVLRDEGEAYAEKLRQAGNLVELHRYNGAPHGFIRLHNLYETADQAIDDIAAAISRHVR